MSPEEKDLTDQIARFVELRPVNTSPPLLSSGPIRYEADSAPGMPVTFQLMRSPDPRVGTWVAMCFPGRSFCDPPAVTLRAILQQLRTPTP